MRYIKKTSEPTDFVAWKTVNADKIKDLFAKYNAGQITKSDVVWGLLPTKNEETRLGKGEISYSKENLRIVLLNEQGGICAYCGSRILNNWHTRLEHVGSKSKRIEGTFDYFNIVAVCSGGQYRVHTVQKGDTLEKIAAKYATTVDYLLRLNPNLAFVENTELEVKIGTEPINIKVIFEHCDVKKGSNSIDINPLQSDCQAKFKYDMNGIVFGDDVKQVIEDLGLNDNPFVVEKRQNIRERIRTTSNLLIHAEPRRFRAIKQQKLDKLYADAHNFEEMAFVHEYAWNTFK